MNMLKRIGNKGKQVINRYYDFEMLAVSRIIKKTSIELIRNGTYNSLMKECDKVFIDRLAIHKAALKLEYWKNHFELKGFEEFPEINGHMLDFGCGSGHLDVWLARRGMKITGIDASPIAIKICEYLKKREQKQVAGNLAFFNLDITEPKKIDLVCDCAWSTQVFEHLSNPEQILRGVQQYLKKDAYYLICVPFGNAYDDPGHCNHFYSEAELYDFLSPFINVRKIVIDPKFQVLRALCQF